MQFQSGNKFWLARSSHGRNPIFSNPEQLRNACYEYFEWVETIRFMKKRYFTVRYHKRYSHQNVTMTCPWFVSFIDIDLEHGTTTERIKIFQSHKRN